ncbi:cysteine dioxygenase [Vibrio hepatarius]|uniref:cysteine dioxygenase n=1 Tax=Vibrio hepatarius TaxID=171383 RepID=UPI001C08426A|nr:cysteine dioxygenase family protein [Vibrio hepatarius]MBU2896748.1 cysteine dioxygenase family protein [Vibrio hepatarius]
MGHPITITDQVPALAALFDSDFRLNFQAFIEQIQLANKPLSLATIRFILEHVDLTDEEIKSLVSFDQDNYCRKRLFKNKHCEILILSWLNGQRSKIHDHLNTACGVRVLQGEATETLFETAPNGYIYASQSSHYPKGSVTVSRDNDIHQISNLQADGKPLVTLHVYSPPLSQFHLYQLEKGQPELLDLQQDTWFYEI